MTGWPSAGKARRAACLHSHAEDKVRNLREHRVEHSHIDSHGNNGDNHHHREAIQLFTIGPLDLLSARPHLAQKPPAPWKRFRCLISVAIQLNSGTAHRHARSNRYGGLERRSLGTGNLTRLPGLQTHAEEKRASPSAEDHPCADNVHYSTRHERSTRSSGRGDRTRTCDTRILETGALPTELRPYTTSHQARTSNLNGETIRYFASRCSVCVRQRGQNFFNSRR